MEKFMLKYMLVSVLLLTGIIGFGAAHIMAQAPAPATAPPFNPGFGDLMNTLVQPRHAKLALSAREQNWPLASYAIHELKDALANISRWRPRYRDQPLPEMMEATTGEPIKAIEQAIETHDLKQFNAAYARLTDGCNSCHAALNHEFVVIKDPDRSFFANQDFRPAK